VAGAARTETALGWVRVQLESDGRHSPHGSNLTEGFSTWPPETRFCLGVAILASFFTRQHPPSSFSTPPSPFLVVFFLLFFGRLPAVLYMQSVFLHSSVSRFIFKFRFGGCVDSKGLCGDQGKQGLGSPAASLHLSSLGFFFFLMLPFQAYLVQEENNHKLGRISCNYLLILHRSQASISWR
jgi:hypothetical protein